MIFLEQIKSNPLIKIVNSSLINLPSPRSISYIWNFGSLLGLCLMIQLFTGIFLAIHYSSDISSTFDRIIHITRDVNLGWILRMIHANGARFFFIFLYWHVGRGIYYGSSNFFHTWLIGVTILILVIATAFLGYVLPWGQISFWGATVITNMASAIPLLGNNLVEWLWGGFTVEGPTLTRFFSLHYLLPFIISALSGIHLLYLHESGSSNPLGVDKNFNKIPFHPYFSVKDLLGIISALFLIFFLILINPWLLGDPENFIPANPLITPIHIQPEWYFLFAYAILRSIPRKLGGVLALLFSILILYIMPLFKEFRKGIIFSPLEKLCFWLFIIVILILTWIGICPVKEPYILISQVFTLIYFTYFFLTPIIKKYHLYILNL